MFNFLKALVTNRILLCIYHVAMFLGIYSYPRIFIIIIAINSGGK